MTASSTRLIIVILLLLGVLSCRAPSSAIRTPAPGPIVAAPSPVAPLPPTDRSEEGATIPVGPEDAVWGSRLAPVTIVVFSDFECPFCSKLDDVLARLQETHGPEELRLVFKHNPLGFHPHARLAAEVGQGVLALSGQEAFWRYQSTAFRRQAAIAPETIRAWAQAAGVDAAALERGLDAKVWASKVDADVALAGRLGARGTPSSFVNGVAVSGAQPYDALEQIVVAQREKAKALVANGTPRASVHASLSAVNFKPAAEENDDEPPVAPAAAIHKVPIGSGPTRGPSGALVTIIAFSDFQCPYCKRVEETLARIRREYRDDVRIVWRDMPLSFHARAEPAAELARAARAQKGDAGFWAVHDRLFAAQPALEDSDLERIAREEKLDAARAMAAVHARAYRHAIEADLAVGDDFQTSGAPHFFINGRRFSGAQPFEKWKPILDEEIATAQALLRAGTPRAALYDARVKDGKPPLEPPTRTIAPPLQKPPFRGSDAARVVIQEVGDYQCPYCKRGDGTMDELLKAYPGKIKVVWRNKPLAMHPDAALAAEAAREAFAQKGNDGFAKMHKLLFENQSALKRDDLEGYAQRIGLDMVRFGSALDGRIHKEAVDADTKLADAAGVSGTPAFFIGPYYVSGAAPYAKLRRLVERVLSSPAAPVADQAQAPDRAGTRLR